MQPRRIGFPMTSRSDRTRQTPSPTPNRLEGNPSQQNEYREELSTITPTPCWDHARPRATKSEMTSGGSCNSASVTVTASQKRGGSRSGEGCVMTAVVKHRVRVAAKCRGKDIYHGTMPPSLARNLKPVPPHASLLC